MNVLSNIIVTRVNFMKNCSHIAIVNKDQVRYYVSSKNLGKYRLMSGLAAYSSKNRLLKTMMLLCPLRFLVFVGMAETVKLNLSIKIRDYVEEVSKEYYNNKQWNYNIIIGTYDQRQKIIIQCFDKRGKSIFFKMGSENTTIQMQNEIRFLKMINTSSNLLLPEYITSSEDQAFNILVTKAFEGKKVKSHLDEAVYQVFLEITSYKPPYIENEIEMVFSHGDFTPWNMRRNKNSYLIYDWEYCGYRFYGFDLIHYTFQIQNIIKGIDKVKAIKIAIETAKKYDVKLQEKQSESLASLYWEEIEKSYGRKK